ncbi:hypothetical protein P376_4039 [Streptomyces sp. HCCB10043]|nr:hypothetical protein P376_4039 [Streptomyces sp. HCCB10043]
MGAHTPVTVVQLRLGPGRRGGLDRVGRGCLPGGDGLRLRRIGLARAGGSPGVDSGLGARLLESVEQCLSGGLFGLRLLGCRGRTGTPGLPPAVILFRSAGGERQSRDGSESSRRENASAGGELADGASDMCHAPSLRRARARRLSTRTHRTRALHRTGTGLRPPDPATADAPHCVLMWARHIDDHYNDAPVIAPARNEGEPCDRYRPPQSLRLGCPGAPHLDSGTTFEPPPAGHRVHRACAVGRSAGHERDALPHVHDVGLDAGRRARRQPDHRRLRRPVPLPRGPDVRRGRPQRRGRFPPQRRFRSTPGALRGPTTPGPLGTRPARGLLFMWDPSSPDWRLQMSGFGAAAVVLGIGTVLYRAPSTREFFGIEQPTRGSRNARVASPRPARPVVATAPSAGARTKKTLQVLTWVSLAAAVWGGAMWWNHSDGIPKCGDKVMTAGDVCNTIGSRGGSSSTYEEALQDKKNTALIGKWIVAGGAAVFILSVTGRTVLSRRRDAN